MLMETERLDESSGMQTLMRMPSESIAPAAPDCYVLLVEPQQEVKMFTYLKSYQCNPYLPLVPHVKTRGARRTKVTVYRPMMRGYLFIEEHQFGKAAFALARTDGIHRFLRFGENFAVVPGRQIERVRNIEAELAKPKSIQSIWSIGEMVRVGEGSPFYGFNVTVTDLANGDRIVVEVSMFGRPTRTTLDSALLEKL